MRALEPSSRAKGDGVRRVALVVPNLADGGGVPGVAGFLYRTLEGSDRYSPYLISLAMSARDDQSIRLLDPGSWFRGLRTQKGTWQSRRFVHVGARCAEFEFMRYAPRCPLTELLEPADLVQVVAGAPCWALPACRASAPLLLQVATLTSEERRRRQRVERGPKALWRWVMTLITDRLDRRGLDQADRIFVENRWMERTVAGAVGDDRVVFAPPGVDVDRFRPDGPEQAGMDEPYILSVARFDDPRKNTELLFRAYGMLARQASEVPELRLAGRSGPPASAWRVARDLGVAHRIDYLGPVSDDELERLYRGAEFFVLSSDEEGFGLVLTEAMASGIPVVSTACGGPEGIVTHEEDGLLVPVGDVEELVRAMGRLVVQPDSRERLGRKARRTAVEQFSLERAGRRFLRVYDALLSREEPPGVAPLAAESK